MEMTEGVVFEGWIVVTIKKIIGGWEKGVVMELMEGIIFEGWIVMTIRKIIENYDGDDRMNYVWRMDCGEYQ